MSLPFSDTTTLKGAVQLFELEIGANQGDISGNSTKLKQFTADANVALDYVWNIGLRADGGWQIDDSNHTDYPERTMTLTSGTRRYALSSFTADAGTNLMLEVYKVFVKNPSGIYVEMEPVDVQKGDNVDSFTSGSGATGTPTRYDKTGIWLDLDPIPNYTVSAGIKVLINREPAYFTSADTTKKPGIPGGLHPYIYLKPALDYARRNSLPSYDRLRAEVMEMEQTIRETFSDRDHDTPDRLNPSVHSTR